MNNNDIYVIYGSDYYEMTRKLLEEAKLCERIKKGAKIGIKPNILGQMLPEDGATTHPVIVRAIIDYLKDKGHSNLLILEGAWIGDNTEKSFKLLGYDKISKETGVPLFNTKNDRFEVLEYGGIQMEISKRALDLDFLINVPVLKGHCQTRVTGAMKNLKGIISDKEKRHFHSLGLHRPIAYLNKLICADFVIMDGICGDLDFEEGGNPVIMNKILCCPDSVLIDSYEANALGYHPYEIEHIRLAAELGIGYMDIENANIKELNEDSINLETASSRKVKHLEKYIDERKACSACYANLIRALHRMSERGQITPGLKVSIGQGFIGEKSEGIGVGNCTLEFSKCIQGCPVKTMDIVSALANN